MLTLIASILTGTLVTLQSWIHLQPTYIIVTFFVVLSTGVLAIVNFLWMLWDRWQQHHLAIHSQGRSSLGSPSSIFIIEYIEQQLLWREKDERDDTKMYEILPDIPAPDDAVLVLSIVAKITAAPPLPVYDIQLKIAGESEEPYTLHWPPQNISEEERLLYFEMNIPPGPHTMQLYATAYTSARIRKATSPSFDVYISRSYPKETFKLLTLYKRGQLWMRRKKQTGP